MNEEDVKLEGFEAEGATDAPANSATETEPADGGAVAVEAPAGGESTSSTADAVPGLAAARAPDGSQVPPALDSTPSGRFATRVRGRLDNDQPNQPMQEIEAPAPKPMDVQAETKPPERNLMAGFKELARVHPEVTKQPLPEDIFQAIVMGEQSPLSVYEGMMMRKLSAEIETLRKENQTLRQNAETAAKAPVKASTGAPQTEAQDEFLKGFNLGR